MFQLAFKMEIYLKFENSISKFKIMSKAELNIKKKRS